MIYNKRDEFSIEKYGKKLEGKSLKSMGITDLAIFLDKGGFNKIVEESYFKIDNNNLQIADFSEAQIELKVTPLRRVKKKENSILLRERKGLSMKERTVLTMINYLTLADETWENNSLKDKAFKILFCFYIWEKEQHNLDYIFDLVSLWEPNPNDLEIIKQDWTLIVNKVKEGKAHELSEGDTLYLGACTKGATAKSVRPQPYSDILAKQRAFSFKRSYMDMIYEELLNKKVTFKSINEKNKSLGQSLKDIFSPYINKTIYDIELKFNPNFSIPETIPKSYFSQIANKILGVNSDEIEEFKKAGIELKTMRMNDRGTIQESISFPTFKFLDLLNNEEEQEWETSTLYNFLVETKFFFVVYEINSNKTFSNMTTLEKLQNIRLKKVKLWSPTSYTIDEMEKVWLETKRVLKEGVKITTKHNKNYNNLPGIKFNDVGHVRPHARNRNDTYPLPNGGELTKQCFWFNAEYIKKIISEK